jgi:hypothetical protein
MSGLVKSIFGKSGSERRQIDFKPVSFTSGGLSGQFDKERNAFDITRSDELGGSLQDVVAGFRQRGAGLRGIRQRIGDEVGGLTRSRINRLRSLKDASVGNVRAELQKRRVAGSKFGMGQVASTELGFAELEDEIQSEGDLLETQLQRELIVEESQAAIDAATTMVGQLNLESTLAANVSTSASEAIRANLEASARVGESRRDRNSGIIFGTIGLLGGLFSDQRLKADIRLVGTDSAGINWYTWTWNAIAERLGVAIAPTVGVIAQEVIRQGFGHAVVEHRSGFLKVNYGRLGAHHG